MDNLPINNGILQSNPTAPQTQSVSQQLRFPLDPVTQEILKKYIPQAYPIGSIYMNATDNTDPSIIFGYGVWEAIEGYVIAGYKSGDANFGTIGATIGSATHTLSTDEMPAHSHGNSKFQNLGGVANLGFVAGGWVETASTDSAGNSQPHNNIQPTLVAYVWKRTA